MISELGLTKLPLKSFGLRKSIIILVVMVAILVIIQSLFVFQKNTVIVDRTKNIDAIEVPVLNKAHALKLSVVQVQQWLTDISATRGRDGLNDGFDEAQKNAELFKSLIDELISLDSQHAKQYKAMTPVFDAYYNVGKKMARAYIDKGPEAGNQMMAEFDEVAAAISVEVDGFLEKAIYRISLALEQQQQAVNTSRNSFFVGALGIFITVITMFLFVIKAFKPLVNLIDTVKRLGEGESSIRIKNIKDDEFGDLAKAFNTMAQHIEDDIERERKNTEELTQKVTLITSGVKQAATGDLTSVIMKDDSEGIIGQLSENIQNMINSLDQLVKQVQISGIQVMSTTTQISATAKEQEATVAEQAASTNEIMATIVEIAATDKHLLETMDNVRKLAENTSYSASEGNDSLISMKLTMEHLKKATDSISSKLDVLSEKADGINNVVNTINRIADQTNLLSLNAAIEAEKAGEYGLGFSVVASEIRRLADQTAVSSWDIGQMVKEISSAVSVSVMSMDKFTQEVDRGAGEVEKAGSQLGNIIEQVQALSPQFESVTESMAAQVQGAEQIKESITELNQTTQHTAASLKESNESIVNLKTASLGLQEGVSIFKVSQ